MPTRKHNWDVAVAVWATDLLDEPFEWGLTDCASLVRGVMATMYDEELWPALPGYASRSDALRVLSTMGSVREQLQVLGASKHVLTFTQPGDIVIAPALDGEIFDSVLIAINTNRLLITQEDHPIRTIPLYQAPEQSESYRMPHGW